MNTKYLIPIVCLILFSSFVMMKKRSYSSKVQEFTNVIGYSPNQVLMWYTMAHEGYRDYWYKDGLVKYRGKWVQSYSIGFGRNDHGNPKEHREIDDRIRDKNGNVVFEKCVQEVQLYYKEHPCRYSISDIFLEVATRLHCYNRGSLTVIGKVDRCCKNKKGIGCGNPDKNIQKSHNKRRPVETFIATRNVKAFLPHLLEAKAEVEKLYSKYSKK